MALLIPFFMFVAGVVAIPLSVVWDIHALEVAAYILIPGSIVVGWVIAKLDLS